ncbi:molybdate ABC transporter substrate-binding protein [Cellvibrio fontiphilus]|uniref:Molybdate ABC transporter substrate-binding protein n=1 Tax=Cellvibrio fontiphilus TaxID=1815559 RepID=A0ABV7FFQ3_9GAMM
MFQMRLLLALLLIWAPLVQAEKITIAAAADLKFAMDELVATFKQQHATDEVEVIYGSSGKFYTQIQQGAPFDLYFSADIDYPRQLANLGLAGSAVTPHALGRLVLWSATRDASQMTLADLTDPAIKRIAIANPRVAPYGKRAVEALKQSGLWDKLEPKLVYGENIAQTAQFVQTGNAQIGIIALALAISPELASKGGYWLVPAELHAPLEQGFIITKRAENNGLASKFATYIESKAARAVMTRYGFALPGDGAGTGPQEDDHAH